MGFSQILAFLSSGQCPVPNCLDTESLSDVIYVCIYVYIYIYIYVCLYICVLCAIKLVILMAIVVKYTYVTVLESMCFRAINVSVLRPFLSS